MARIPEDELERLKKEISVERLVEASGVALKRAGKDLLGRCPYHDDREASLVVSPEPNLWHCFGCQIGGGPIDWVMKANGVSFRHAVELLRAGPTLTAGSGGAKRSRRRKLPAPVALDAGDRELLDQVIDFYHQTLLASPEVLAYLGKRGLADRELIERFRLGFANRTLGLRLPETRLKAGAELRGRLQRIGILRESGHEHFNGCLVVPVIDEAGAVTEVYGRKITEGVNPPLHLYLPGHHRGPARGVWNVQALQNQKEVILCEALIDAMSFWCAGYRNLTASYGVEGFTEDHLAVFKRYRIERVLIAYDRDEAGDRAAEKLAERLIAEGFECYRIQFPKGMDANEYALKVTPSAKSLGLVIRKALWLGKGEPPPVGPGERVEDIVLESDDAPSRTARPTTETIATLSEPSVELPSLAASPATPPAPVADIDAEVSDDEVIMSFGDRRYRIRGLAKNLSYETLKVNVLVSRAEIYYVDAFDLYSARQRSLYLAAAAKELAVREEVVKLDLGRVLLKLEALQEAKLRAALEVEPAVPAMSDEARAEALAFLRAPDLLGRILADFEAAGLVGEATNKLIAYLAAVSRKLDSPLAVLIQSSSAAGKSALMDAVLAFIPEEERVKYSAMTGQSLFYMGGTNLKHKILAVAEEEGAARATYALKLLQSEGELTIASTGKDPTTGNLVTQEYRVEGPVALVLTTTAIEIDEELTNRCLVLSVDEGRDQTEAIHRLQRTRRTLAGLQAKHGRQGLVRLHRNAQRLLRSLPVVNPYADQLTFLSDKTRTRRDHEKYLTLIDAIALLHQYQRPLKTTSGAGGEPLEYVEATLEDVAMANRIAHEALGRSLDHLSPQTRRLLLLIDAMVAERAQTEQLPRSEIRFSRRQVREHTSWSDFPVKVHMQKLTDLEYLLTHRGGRGQAFEYELVYDGDGSGATHLCGLIDVAALTYDGDKEHAKRELESSRSAQVAAELAGGSAPSLAATLGATSDFGSAVGGDAKMHFLKGNGERPSYAPPSPLLPASPARGTQ